MRTREPYFAPVCSIGLMEALWERRLLGSYHLVLAHKILDDPGRWIEFYNNVRARAEKEDPNHLPFIIVDNSLVELGYAMEADDLIIAAGLIQAQCIVLPDVFKDSIQTFDASKEASIKLTERLTKQKRKTKVKFMGVVQGEDAATYQECAANLCTIEGVKYLAIPRIAQDILGSRKSLTLAISKKHRKPIHLLGFSYNIQDDILAACTNRVMGIDSSLPVSIGLRNQEMKSDFKMEMNHNHRPMGYLELEQDAYNDYIAKNVAKVCSWLSDAQKELAG